MTEEFRVGDKVRTIVGEVVLSNCYRVTVEYHDETRATYHTDYVELVERAFIQPDMGRLFTDAKGDDLYISYGPRGYRRLRVGAEPRIDSVNAEWTGASADFRANLVVLPI